MTADRTDARPPHTAHDLAACLLPQPHTVTALPGTFALTDGLPVYLAQPLEAPEQDALQAWLDECVAKCGVRLARHDGAPPGRSPAIVVRVDPAAAPALADAARAAQGYTLRVTPGGVDLAGASAVGLFYGLQTLRQLVSAVGHVWPGVEIRDVPQFAVRGLSYDVTRGKVPTLAALQELADRLSAYKVNQLQLYIEHTFAFQFNPNIGRGCSPLTADELRTFDAYCARRRIALVPSLASFGHMGFILSLPEYRHLAEIETPKSWSDMTWQERMHGLTLDTSNPESRALLERMYAEVLPLFSSPLANVTCDETYDLGRGKTHARATEGGVGRLYLAHLGWLRELCARYGKRAIFWGDILKKFPDLLKEIPRDVIAAHWDYDPDADYDSTALFCNAGLTTYVCPGTSSWNRVLNGINDAELNIRRFAAAGVRYGAAGLLNTDWGDEGHFNLVASSWHPIVLGAALGWNIERPTSAEFDGAFGRQILADPSGLSTDLLRSVATASDLSRSWPVLAAPLTEVLPPEPWTPARLEAWRSVSLAAADHFAATLGRLGAPASAGATGGLPASASPVNPGTLQDLRELEVACRMNALVADRIELARAIAAAPVGRIAPALADRLRKFATTCETLAPQYETVWLARNKRSNLDDILAVFRRLAAETRAAAG